MILGMELRQRALAVLAIADPATKAAAAKALEDASKAAGDAAEKIKESAPPE